MAEEVMEFEDGFESNSFMPSMWSLSQVLELDRFCFSLWALCGDNCLVGVLVSAYAGLQRRSLCVLPWWGSLWGIEVVVWSRWLHYLWEIFLVDSQKDWWLEAAYLAAHRCSRVAGCSYLRFEDGFEFGLLMATNMRILRPSS
ncbi:unnamed protein product [Arabidopsis thaliana]|uniref:Uncharacterized protein n=1 Tax=Arabidopsis thaliana TaxID=3702 RepID=A0A5S9XH03_ARATH|nr:unnamed protein product [Arabidopsis thaliana]